ncbi:hypothetical protein PVAP13_8NG299601 [Panicum virgatum]|uniref:Uncharacterized protein n=1 Tax=Panicum virgatum TaxID=38727 RepID=A0A8T0PK52_PANVG|nr:hypothetical protein PVAP13_8NG299601 [Panicum virgatum]
MRCSTRPMLGEHLSGTLRHGPPSGFRHLVWQVSPEGSPGLLHVALPSHPGGAGGSPCVLIRSVSMAIASALMTITSPVALHAYKGQHYAPRPLRRRSGRVMSFPRCQGK